MRTITTRAELYGPSSGVNYSGGQGQANAPQSTTATQSTTVTNLFTNLQTSFLAAPIVWLAGAVLALIGWKLLEEHTHEREEFSEVKIGVANWFKLGVMMLVFFAVMKFLATRYNIPGASSFVIYATGGAANAGT